MESKTNVMKAFSLEDYIKQTIYDKHMEADALLQKYNAECRQVDTQGRVKGKAPSEGFKAAVLSEYRMIAPKLGYLPMLVPGHDDFCKKFDVLSELEQYMYPGKDTTVDVFIHAHALIGEFIEIDGVSKFERQYPNMSRIFG